MGEDPNAHPTQGSEASGSRLWRALALAAAGLFVVLALHAARLETPTVDEFAHVPAGHAIWAHGDLALYSKNPPLGKILLATPSVLAGTAVTPKPQEPPFGWGPWQYGRRFMKANRSAYFDLFFSARAVVVGFTLLAAGFIFVWTRSLFGERAAAASASLFLLCPTVLAHGHLATLDVMCTASIVASLWMLRWALSDKRLGRFAIAGITLGLAMLVKFTALLLLPVYALLIPWSRRKHWKRALGELAAVFGAALLVLNFGMGFTGSFAPLGSFQFGSDFGQTAQAILPNALPIPVPADYVRGFDAQKRDVERAEFPSYLRGNWSREGVWYYEAVALAVKTPLLLLFLLALTPYALWRSGVPTREMLFLAVPVAVLGTLLTGLNALNVGIRYLLPLYPPAFIAMGAVFARSSRTSWSIAAVAASAALALWIHPGHLGYFNPLAGGPEGGHRWLLDSNLDWGQDLYRLPAAVKAIDPDQEAPLYLLYFGHVEPELYGLSFAIPPREPVAGLVAASASYLAGFAYPAPAPGRRTTKVKAGALDWLMDREPVLRIGSIWLFDTREADVPPR